MIQYFQISKSNSCFFLFAFQRKIPFIILKYVKSDTFSGRKGQFMFSKVLSATIDGARCVPVCVEADVSNGLPMFSMVGDLTSQVKEAQERVRTAIKNMGNSGQKDYGKSFAGRYPKSRKPV